MGRRVLEGSDGIQQLHKLLQLIASTSQYCQRCSQIPNKCQFDMTWIVSLQVWRLKHKWNIYSIRDALVSKRKHLFDQRVMNVRPHSVRTIHPQGNHFQEDLNIQQQHPFWCFIQQLNFSQKTFKCHKMSSWVRSFFYPADPFRSLIYLDHKRNKCKNIFWKVGNLIVVYEY